MTTLNLFSTPADPKYSPLIWWTFPGSLIIMDEPMSMDGISGILVATHKVRVQYEVINDAVSLSIIECGG